MIKKLIMYYECHITMQANPYYSEQIRKHVEDIGWKFSKIDGDPVLGEGVKMYATMHYKASKPIHWVLGQLDEASAILMASSIQVIREKVELVLYDSKQSAQ